MTTESSDVIINNPIDVLLNVTSGEPSRPPWRGWVAAAYGEGSSPAETAQALATLEALCSTVDRLASECKFNDTKLSVALKQDLLTTSSSTGQTAQALRKEPVAALRNILSSKFDGVERKQLTELIRNCHSMIEMLQAVTNMSAPFALAAAGTLRQLDVDLRRAETTGILFVDPAIFIERNRTICIYGLTLQREGLAREGALLIAIGVALIGLLPPLALPAAAASITWAIAERAGEQERLGRRASQQLEPPDFTG